MTELELQRIVDGELTGGERARCLSQLNEQSPLWRTLALSLLADQDLRRCFQQSGPHRKSRTLQTIVAPATNSQSVHTARWSLAMAASLLAIIVGGFGWLQIGGWKMDAPASSPVVTNGAVESSIVPESTAIVGDDSEEPTLVNWQPSGKMRLSASDESQEPVELPVYEVDQLSPQAIISQQVAELESLTEQYHKLGWRAGLDTHVYEGQLEDGRKLFIPVNVMHLEPISY